MISTFAQDFLSQFLSETWGFSLTTWWHIVVAIGIIVLLIVGVMFIYHTEQAIRTILRTLVYSVFIEVGVHTFFYNGIFFSDLCCTNDHPSLCPIWLSPFDYGLMIGLFMGRLALYASYKCCRKDTRAELNTKQTLKEKTKYLLQGQMNIETGGGTGTGTGTGSSDDNNCNYGTVVDHSTTAHKRKYYA
jgi:hypothetical protein